MNKRLIGNQLLLQNKGAVSDALFIEETTILNQNSKIITKEWFEQKKLWGIATAIDLFDCNPKIIRDAEAVKRYVRELCDLIEMKRFGECNVVNFGKNPKVTGFSMTQLIETSLISGHFANNSNSSYIDIFSCKWYDQEKAIEFTKNFFKAKKTEFNVFPRGKGIV